MRSSTLDIAPPQDCAVAEQPGADYFAGRLAAEWRYRTLTVLMPDWRWRVAWAHETAETLPQALDDQASWYAIVVAVDDMLETVEPEWGNRAPELRRVIRSLDEHDQWIGDVLDDPTSAPWEVDHALDCLASHAAVLHARACLESRSRKLTPRTRTFRPIIVPARPLPRPRSRTFRPGSRRRSTRTPSRAPPSPSGSRSRCEFPGQRSRAARFDVHAHVTPARRAAV